MSYYQKHIFICVNQKAPGKTCCANQGGESFLDYLKEKLLELDLYGPHKIRVSRSGCLGRCASGPSLVIYPDGIWYRYTTFQDLDEIIKKHLMGGEKVEHLLMPESL